MGHCRFAPQLKAPALSFLWDHVVAKRSIMPGAGMFEMTACAARSLAPEGARIGLTGVTIPSPLALSGAAAPAAEALLDCRTGAVQLITLSGRGPGECGSLQA